MRSRRSFPAAEAVRGLDGGALSEGAIAPQSVLARGERQWQKRDAARRLRSSSGSGVGSASGPIASRRGRPLPRRPRPPAPTRGPVSFVVPLLAGGRGALPQSRPRLAIVATTAGAHRGGHSTPDDRDPLTKGGLAVYPVRSPAEPVSISLPSDGVRRGVGCRLRPRAPLDRQDPATRSTPAPVASSRPLPWGSRLRRRTPPAPAAASCSGDRPARPRSWTVSRAAIPPRSANWCAATSSGGPQSGSALQYLGR